MIISQSKLGQRYKPLANEIDLLLNEARNLGATEGAQRLEAICSQYDQLSPNVAYQWLDPGAFQREVEEAQTHGAGAEFIHFFRNVFSLAPLIVTWGALFSAVNTYQEDLAMHITDRTRPFLELWQSGFNGITWVTFTVAAGFDVILLFLYLLFILLTHQIDSRAHSVSTKFAKKLQGIDEKLMKVIATDGVTHIVDQSGVDKVADAVQKVVQKAVDASTKIATAAEQSIKQVTDVSTKAITDSNSRMDDVFKKQIDPLISAFRTDMAALQKELGNYQGRLNDLTNASQQLASASSTLTANAERYTTIGQDIKTQIASLNATQQDVLAQIRTVSGGISTAAGNMTTATTNMTAATKAVQGVATQLSTGMQTSINAMTMNVDRAAQSLAQVGPQLNQASYQLNNAARLLASIQGNPQVKRGLLARIFRP